MNKWKRIIIALFILFVFKGTYNIAYAEQSLMYIAGESFESIMPDVSDSNKTSMFCYGKDSLGFMAIEGDIVNKGIYEGVPAYAVNDVIQFRYSYDGTLNKTDKEDWHLASSNEKTVMGISLPKKVGSGTILVQKSLDGKSWIEATDYKYGAFDKANISKNKDIIYTTSIDEIMQGTYYRIIIGYQVRRQISPAGFMKNAEYEYRSCVEEYLYYICTDQNYVVLRDVNNKSTIPNGASVYNGFYIDKSGSYDKVTVSRDGGLAILASQNDSFYDAGNYVVEITNKLGKKFTYNVRISDGYSYVSILPKVYESKKNTGFLEETFIQKNTSAGIQSLTSLKIAQDYGYSATKSEINGYDAYGINGDSVCIMLHLHYSDNLIDNGWVISEDHYGKKEKELICGVQTGEVGKGAVIVQTSLSGEEDSWVDLTKEKYANGLYTTNFGEYYKANEDIVLYTPKGIQKGLYLRVIYVYQTFNSNTKMYVDCKEKYEFYLCSDELGAIQYHNLSLKEDSFETLYGDANENQIALMKNAETLANNTGTTTGFTIDKTKNPTVTYTVEKDGKTISSSEGTSYTTTGRYDIHLTSAVGTKHNITIYVDRSDNDQALKNYFGDGFIQGKRIYTADYFPIFEGGNVKYNIEEISDNYMPVYGVLINTSTGEEIKIGASREARQGVLSTPGNYTAVLHTGFDDASAIGDIRTFTFNFRIIPKGMAPGPKNNRESLEKYIHTNISDSYPLYYGVKYQSASGIPIIRAFKDKESAKDFMYAYEKGNVIEELSDGTYRYNGSFLGVEDSIRFNDNIGEEMPNILAIFAEQAVKLSYFDLSSDSTYMTLEDKYINATSNLRKYELNRTVVVFGEGEKALLTDLDALPIISPKPYAYITPGNNGAISVGYNDFEFVRDKYGCDSDKVIITDCNGKQFEIEYGGSRGDKGVGKQLQEKGCATGIVTITESTAWGDISEYQAVFIQKGDNTSKLKISYYQDGQEKINEFRLDTVEKRIVADAFSVESIEDELDPYSLVIISKDGQILQLYAADQFTKGAWSEVGEYEIKVVNRLGFGYTINVSICESDYCVLSFEGDGTENVKDIITSFGNKNIKLPELEKEGYKLVGFIDENGKQYVGDIEKITNKGNVKLTAKWEPIKVNIQLLNIDQSVYETREIMFGDVFYLPVLKTEFDKEFVGWMYAGEICTNQIIVTSTEDILLSPVIRDLKTGKTETIYSIQEKKQRGTINFLFLVGISVICVTLIVYMRLKKKTDKENKDETKEEAQ